MLIEHLSPYLIANLSLHIKKSFSLRILKDLLHWFPTDRKSYLIYKSFIISDRPMLFM